MTTTKINCKITSFKYLHPLVIPFTNIPVNPSNRINQLPSSQDIEENDLINKNRSEIINSTENFEQKHQISDNRELKINSNPANAENQLISSPSSPIPCNALWDNISNEKLLCQRKKHRFPLIRKKQSDQSKIRFLSK